MSNTTSSEEKRNLLLETIYALSYPACDELLKQLNEYEASLTPKSEAVENKWIIVEDRLPEDEKVIAYFPNGDESGKKISTGTCWGRKVVSDFPNSTASFFEATHWQPLPSPPIFKSSQEENQ